MNKQITIGVVLVVAAFCIAAPDKQKPPDRPQRDIYGTLVPRGKLGYPIGTFLKIEGIRAEVGKVGVNTLSVEKVNGIMLSKPPCIWVDNIDSLPKGQRRVLPGYESGKWIGTPPDVIKNLGGIALEQAAWCFYRFFLVISAEEPKELREKFPTKASSARGDPRR